MTKYPNNIDQINSTKINYAAIDRPPTIKWYKLGVKLRKLERSIAPGLFLCLAACVLRQTCYLYYSEYVASHDSIRPFDGIVGFMFDFIWEIGVCFGALCSGFKQRTWSIRWTNTIIGIMLLMSIGLNIKLDNEEDLNEKLIFSRISGFLGGISFGFIYTVLISNVADNVSKSYRGFVITKIAFIEPCLPVYLVYGNIWHYIFFVIVIVSIVVTWLLKYESVTSSLESNSVEEAERNFTELHNGSVSLTEIRKEIDEKIKMMQEDDHENDSGFLGIFSNGNWKPIFLMILLQLTSQIIVNQALLIYVTTDILCKLALSRILILIVHRFSVDYIGRKFLLLISTFVVIICMLIQILKSYFIDDQTDDHTFSEISLILTFIYAIGFSLGIDPLKHIYNSEAFPLLKRNASLAFVTIVSTIGTFILIPHFVDLAGTSLFILLPLLLLLLPETKQKSLRHCQIDFNSYYKRYDI